MTSEVSVVVVAVEKPQPVVENVVSEVSPEAMRHLSAKAADECRTVGSLIANILEDWVFGVTRRWPRPTEEELAHLAREHIKPKRTTVKQSVRLEIFARDKGICRHCGGQLRPNDSWHIDHLVPVVKGGSSDPANLALSCRACNLQKWAN